MAQQWTTDKPTRPGWWWVWGPDYPCRGKVHCVLVEEERGPFGPWLVAWVPGMDFADPLEGRDGTWDGCLWMGPIKQPEPPQPPRKPAPGSRGVPRHWTAENLRTFLDEWRAGGRTYSAEAKVRGLSTTRISQIVRKAVRTVEGETGPASLRLTVAELRMTKAERAARKSVE